MNADDPHNFTAFHFGASFINLSMLKAALVLALLGRASHKESTNHILKKTSRNHYTIMAHSPPLNIYAIGAMSSVLVVYAWLKSPIKYKWAAENRLSPKADLAWREGAQKWLDNN